MGSSRINIAIIEPSDIIFEGLSTLLLKTDSHFSLFRIKDFDDFDRLRREGVNIVIMSPTILQNRINDFTKLKRQHPTIVWFGLIYSYFDNELISKFSGTISVSDSIDIIVSKLHKHYQQICYDDNLQEQLSEREIDVLVQLVKGFSNKEIGEKLNISTHTVISHRKNIIEKTGIKSLPGLTIYAISKNIIPLDTTPQ